VFQSYSLEKIATLKGHIQLVSELYFSENDFSLFSCGQDGGVYEWNTISWNRMDYVQFNAKYSGITLTK
jgi:WD40 repeat protein